MASERIDALDVEVVYDTVKKAVVRARSGVKAPPSLK